MHEHIRRKEDINRAGTGVYSSGMRDDAEDARNSLLNLLNQIPGKESFLALMDIAKVHPEGTSRPWIMHLAKTKAEQDGDIEPWSPPQIRDFHDRLERTPWNHRELAELAVLRLLDLKDDLEHSDSSIAGILRTVTQETEMRNYIGRELREKAFGRYSIPQEEELADAERPPCLCLITMLAAQQAVSKRIARISRPVNCDVNCHWSLLEYVRFS